MKKIVTSLLVSSFIIAVGPAFAYSPVINVIIYNNRFVPEVLTINVGQTVNWINRDPASHTVSSPFLGSNQIEMGQAYSFQFIQPGHYHYVSQIDPQMHGEIIVK